jgi:hypothetical protein
VQDCFPTSMVHDASRRRQATRPAELHRFFSSHCQSARRQNPISPSPQTPIPGHHVDCLATAKSPSLPSSYSVMPHALAEQLGRELSLLTEKKNRYAHTGLWFSVFCYSLSPFFPDYRLYSHLPGPTNL